MYIFAIYQLLMFLATWFGLVWFAAI